MNLPAMPEAILRRIWRDQSFTQEHLTTTDGHHVTILSPGRENLDGGPDFLNARISIGNVLYRGDVELHINAEGWLAHKHDADPHYNTVILHVVLTADPLSPPARTVRRRAIPLLVLHPFLDETLRLAWSTALLDEHVSASRKLPCAPVNDAVPAELIRAWLEKLALQRVELKVRRFEERLKQLIDESRKIVHEPYPRYYGNPAEIPLPHKEYTKKDFSNKGLWEQLLYEGIMEALGYAKNSRQFLLLAQSMHLEQLRAHGLRHTQTMMAMLFGAAGLLPRSSSLPDDDSRYYVAELETLWDSIRPRYKGRILNEADWLFFRLRPGNFPTVRLAAMAFLLPRVFGEESFRNLIRVFKTESLTVRERTNRLHEFFAVDVDAFWRSHYHFGSVSGVRRNTTLGKSRITDILTNVIVPIVLLYARRFKESRSRKNALGLLTATRVTQKNSITEILRQQLFKEKVAVHASFHQQGAIQLYRYYCSQGRCAECAVGKLVFKPPE